MKGMLKPPAWVPFLLLLLPGLAGGEPDPRERVRQQALEVEILGTLRQAEARAAGLDYRRALALLREAELALQRLPSGEAALAGRIRDLRAAWDALAREEAASEARVRQAAAEGDLLRQLAQDRQARSARRALLAASFEEALAQARFPEADQALQALQEIDPAGADVALLRKRLEERRHHQARESTGMAMAEEWRNLREFSREQQIPYADSTLRYPDGWNRRVRGRQAEIKTVLEQEAAWRTALAGKLQSSVHVRFDQTPFPDAVAALEALGRVTINLDRSAREAVPDLDALPVTFRTGEEGMALETALAWLVKGTGLVWTPRDEALLVSTPEGARETTVLSSHDVRDILAVPRDFAAPKISLSAGNSNPGTQFEEVEQDEDAFTGDLLVEFLKAYVDPAAWNEPQNSIAFRNGALLVNAPPATQRAVRQALAGFRNQRALQVLIQTRFIITKDVFMEEMGVSWNGGNSNAPLGTPADGLVNSGITDYRLRTTDSTTGGAAWLQARFPRAFNGNLNPTGLPAGGLGGTIAFLDDFQVMAFIKAVEQSSKANLLTAPTLLCFNTQRANMVNVTQQAYVQDYTAVVQVSAVGYDPEVGYVMTGIVFDVRPIVSADRKYITLELRPTVSLLTSMRLITVVSGGTPLALEAPIVNMQAIRTTVSVPDGGTLLIGGLTNYDETSNYSGTPFLSKIPFLSALFSYRGKASNRQSIVILVKAQIIDQREIEDTQYGKE
mgnify:CR=1 FL=1